MAKKGEFTQALEEAKQDKDTAATFIPPKRTGVVTVPQFHWSDGETVFIRIETAFTLSDFSRDDKKAATVCRIFNFADRKLYSLVVNAVFQKEIEKNYADASYVGKCFEATKSAERKQGAKGGAYNTFEIYPTEDPG